MPDSSLHRFVAPPLSSPPGEWLPLPARLDDPQGDIPLSRRQLRLRALILEARRIPLMSRGHGVGWQLLVPAGRYGEALEELRRYEEENRGWPPPPPVPTPLIDNGLTTLWVLILLGVFHDLTLAHLDLFGPHPVDWKGLGNAHAGKILDGEWWRLVTALTLHADWQHLLGNLLIGGVFIAFLCRDLGAGPGWSLILASGILGNLANAWLQSPGHRSVGASTAIFGVVGLLAAIRLVRHRHHLGWRRRWPLPLASALALLAMLGAGGENTDLGAHLFGFLFGLLLGGGAEWLLGRFGRPGRAVNALLASASLALVGLAWRLALGAAG